MYIGKEPIVGNFQVCDAISVVNGQAAYTMQVSSTNVVPESVNHMLVSLNGILQKPGSSFTISGSTITFASALATGDVIDFIMLLGNVLDLGVPSDATVTDAKANFVSTSSAAGLQIKGDGTTDGTLQLNCSQNSHGVKIASPAHSAGQSYTLTLPTGNVTADKFLKVASVSGSGTTGIGQLSFADASGGMQLLATTTISDDSSVAFDSSLITDTHQSYKLIIENLRSGTDSVYLSFQVSSDNGSNYITSGYSRFVYYGDTGGNVGNSGGDGTKVGLQLNGSSALGNAGREALHGEITIFGLRSTVTDIASIHHVQFSKTNAVPQVEIGGSYYATATAMNNIKLVANSGNLASGRIKLYGFN